MTVREFLDLFTGVPLDTDVVLDGGYNPEGVTYDAENHLAVVNATYDDDEADDYFTDEDLEGDDDRDTDFTR
jgi:hypothetical protein